MKDFLKKVISNLLTQESTNSIKVAIYKFKNKHKWIFRFIYGTANDEAIFNNILQKLDGKIDILMIHSSFDSMIPMYTGNLSTLLSLIISYCKQNNVTLVMPTFFLGSNYQAKEHYKNGKHIFDVNKTFSQMGLLSEIFRRTQDVKRSIHPTHSICALGPLADKLVRNHHEADTTFGEGTPFSEMIKYRTTILGIGTKIHRALTQVHTAEDIMRDKFPIPLYSDTLPVTCIDEWGNTLNYNLHFRKPEYILDVKVVYKILRKKVKKWTYKGIPFLLTKANIVTETVIEAAKNGKTIYKRIK